MSRRPTSGDTFRTDTAGLPIVAFDESGNTGQALLDPAQPIFVLASVHLSLADASRLTQLVRRPADELEAKFKKLRRSRDGQARVLALLADSRLDPAHVKLSIFHKPFMVTTKMVDVLVEPLLHARGIDLYADGANLGLANLWHAVMPVYTSVQAFQALEERFVVMCRQQAPESVEAFYSHIAVMRDINQHRDFDHDLQLLAATRAVVDEALHAHDQSLLDPHIPAFVDLAAQWTARFDAPFVAINDPARPLARFREQLELLMGPSNAPTTFSKLGAARQFPIQATGIQFADSATTPAIQVADVIAGAAAAVCGAVARGERDPFVDAMLATSFREVLEATERLWPTHAVTREALQSELREGSAALDTVIDLAAREHARRARSDRGGADPA